MALKIIWSPYAASNLEEICEYISRDSKYYAAMFAKKIIKIIKEIPNFPGGGRIVPEYSDENLREKIYGNYRIIYRVQSDVIEIAAICHGNRLLENALL
ncbi:MAG TPA: type II toxin-antitoxin system RelE/ParE family toxin [Candidatus Kapabacteria bacterium]|nr:type II toxin-antitoxin system RelE/ParE family toxin [Candidatus Kapabacteria bacterium]